VVIEHDDDPDNLSAVMDDIDMAELGRFVLVEKNVGGVSPPSWYTTHDTSAEAGAYHVGQEYRHDWEPVGLWDLDTGERFDPVVSMTFEAHR
jgi:hypothetical protein